MVRLCADRVCIEGCNGMSSSSPRSVEITLMQMAALTMHIAVPCAKYTKHYPIINLQLLSLLLHHILSVKMAYLS